MTKTIPPTGGSVAVEDENGVRLEVSFPVGAVLEGTRVTLRPVEPPSGVRARFALEPAGLPLLAAATFTVKLPPGILVRENDGLSFQNGTRVFVPTDVDTGTRTLTASLYQLGFADPGPGFRASASAVLDGESGNFIDVGAMTCQILRDALTDQILRAQAWSGPFPPDLASPLILEYRAALQACESVDSIAGLTGVLREYACSNLASAETNSQVTLITTAEELKRNLGFLVAAEALSQLSGADCHVQTATMDTEFNEFLDAYIERIEDPAFTRSFPTWGALWGEIKHCVEILALAQQFGVDAVQPKITNELFPALFEKLHDVALEACDADENNSFLLDLLTGGHELDHAVTPVREIPPFSGLSQPEVVDQLLRCGSSVTVETRTPANDFVDTAVIELADQSGFITATDPGTIVITNDILGFTCNGIVQRPPIRVRAELPGHLPVAQLGTLAGSMNINVAATISALPEISPGVRPEQFVLVVERDRSVCGIDAPGVIELCRVVVFVD